ncbi:polyhydroxyalkanoic acid system family protein [Variovorax sp. Root473]|uniref:polyhydroxyalkanoic acid system family protein n=1 Tax=Variovorax sp. Root473 TaxID=1736541 RepID=UPI0006FB6B4D|nr:polyhydroxyalkanoic acid system family protein [Variovorax sp. Root473]KQX84450.1 polyhydroxyalkanoic acid synthase [Variovorax sp. Root473]
MSDIHIERNHTLGMAGAREVARQWVQQVEQDYGLEFTYTEGANGDVAQFSRAGIDGTFEITGDTFRIEATLGFLFSSFSGQIEQKIARNLDALLEAPGRSTRLA